MHVLSRIRRLTASRGLVQVVRVTGPLTLAGLEAAAKAFEQAVLLRPSLGVAVKNIAAVRARLAQMEAEH